MLTIYTVIYNAVIPGNDSNKTKLSTLLEKYRTENKLDTEGLYKAIDSLKGWKKAKKAKA